MVVVPKGRTISKLSRQRRHIYQCRPNVQAMAEPALLAVSTHGHQFLLEKFAKVGDLLMATSETCSRSTSSHGHQATSNRPLKSPSYRKGQMQSATRRPTLCFWMLAREVSLRLYIFMHTHKISPWRFFGCPPTGRRAQIPFRSQPKVPMVGQTRRLLPGSREHTGNQLKHCLWYMVNM